MPVNRSPADLLPLKQDVVLILLALTDRPSHGYGLMRAIEMRSGGEMALPIGTLYRTLKRMLDDGLIVACDPPSRSASGDARRRYYRMTPFGARVLAAEIARMKQLTRAARQFVDGSRPRLA
jgi:DNA-binding PadR family transcriptional regulator